MSSLFARFSLCATLSSSFAFSEAHRKPHFQTCSPANQAMPDFFLQKDVLLFFSSIAEGVRLRCVYLGWKRKPAGSMMHGRQGPA